MATPSPRGLSSISIGALNLNPKFDNGIYEYTVNTPNASNKLTVVPVNEDSDVVITNNGALINNGTSVTWDNGNNDVVIFVDGLEYFITVVRG